MDVAFFSSLKIQWRVLLTDFKDRCVRNRVNTCTIPKEEFAVLLKNLVQNNTINNAENIRFTFTVNFYRYRYWYRYQLVQIPVLLLYRTGNDYRYQYRYLFQ